MKGASHILTGGKYFRQREKALNGSMIGVFKGKSKRNHPSS
jgi:hypothetical protein